MSAIDEAMLFAVKNEEGGVTNVEVTRPCTPTVLEWIAVRRCRRSAANDVKSHDELKTAVFLIY